jgi:hypothetical protein
LSASNGKSNGTPRKQIHWEKVLTDCIRSGIWGELSPAEQALLPCYYVASDDFGSNFWPKSDLAAMTGLTPRAVQAANKRLIERGLIGRQWDDNFTHAAVTTIREIDRPHRNWKAERKDRERVAHGESLAHRRSLVNHGTPSAPGSNGVAHHGASPSAPAGKGVAHGGSPQALHTSIPIKHSNKPSHSLDAGERDEGVIHQASGEEKKFTDHDVDSIFLAYPKPVKPKESKAAIRTALAKICARPGVADAVKWLLGRVKLFAASPAGAKGKFVPDPPKWFDGDRFDEDATAWEEKSGDDPLSRAGGYDEPQGFKPAPFNGEPYTDEEIENLKREHDRKERDKLNKLRREAEVVVGANGRAAE